METVYLKMRTLSDACFARGDGVAGYVDTEVKHDRHGIPYVDGRTVKGLLAAACAEILDALSRCGSPTLANVTDTAAGLFGAPGSAGAGAKLRVGKAELPRDLRDAIADEYRRLDDEKKKRKLKREYLEAFTVTRRLTAMDETGAPKAETLRTVRLMRRGFTFLARLECEEGLDRMERNLLAACAAVLARAGSGRNRGYGKLETLLLGADGQDITQTSAPEFTKEVLI